MGRLADVARFHTDDRDELVQASLACPVCLSTRKLDWTLEGGYDPSVECVCRRCERGWTVHLTPQQAMRLAFMAWRTA